MKLLTNTKPLDFTDTYAVPVGFKMKLVECFLSVLPIPSAELIVKTFELILTSFRFHGEPVWEMGCELVDESRLLHMRPSWLLNTYV